MLAGVHEAEVGGWEVGSEGEEGAEGADGRCFWYLHGECFGQVSAWPFTSSEERNNSLSPAMFLMKTCIVGSGSAEEEREEMGESEDSDDEMLLERMIPCGVLLSERRRCLRW